MPFDPRRTVFHADGSLDHFAQLGYQDDLVESLGRSREALAAGDAFVSVYCDALVHCVHQHHRIRLVDLDEPGLRRLLLETLPRYVETVATDAPVIVATLDALFSWLRRVHRVPSAGACLAVLREHDLVAQLAAAIDDPALEAYRPTMLVMSFDEDGDVDDPTL